MTLRRRHATILAGGLLAAGLVACGGEDDATEVTGGTVAHVGELPELQTGRGDDGRPAQAAGASSPTPAAVDEGTGSDASRPEATAPDETVGDTEPDDDAADTAPDSSTPDSIAVPEAVIGEVAAGNRILALGDSITAAIGPQYGGQLCEALEDQGWFLGVDAFQGRAVDAGLAVLRSDIDVDGWDAAIVNLGSNYRGDPDGYARDLGQILSRLGSIPVVLVTVTEFEDDIAEVNFVIRDLARERDRTWVLEWSEMTRDDESLTGDDGLHLSEAGRAELAAVLADAVGDAPAPGEVEPGCDQLRDAEADAPSRGTDDSSGDGAGDGGAEPGGG